MREVLAWLFPKKLSSQLIQERIVYVQRVKFKIRKINPLDYLSGSRAMRQTFETYKVGKSELPVDMDALKKNYVDVFMAAVIEPKLKRKEESEGEGIVAEALMQNWDLASSLYEQIMMYTYGKKKYSQLLLHAQKS